ncbi:hypothetical protein [Ferrimonas marina]|uniref:Uncharacterized protein n=1 Tax=Ferrimonas marina TaxID=299255 RepID=A0A1M5U5C7_9GAMM|nr:hypothetical protein [Ferrimonas marina]SHH58056.1 hypothetical protein SAMN02745129_2411 [Ferrimonas marina]
MSQAQWYLCTPNKPRGHPEVTPQRKSVAYRRLDILDKNGHRAWLEDPMGNRGAETIAEVKHWLCE